MSKKYSTSAPTLIIVESPAKCKKIEEYLGPGYKCVASFGHLRELKNLENIIIDNGFTVKYTKIETKEKHISSLKKEIKNASEVILATDYDFEGESIAWHICDLFKLNPEKTKRLIFHEVTEKAIQAALRNPSRLNMNIVYAQQTRQIIDLLVGFMITPILWKCICNNNKNGLSAGRCQTPALRIINDNQTKINLNPGQQVYNIIGYFTNLIIPFELNKEFLEQPDIIYFLNNSINHDHILNCSPPEKVYYNPPEPFTTSKIQQTCSNELHISPKETMKLCQELYESGYITYMRTDSKCYSNEFIKDVTTYIENNYDKKYINQEFVDKPALQNEHAHEAIRPTNILLECIPDGLTLKHQRVYKIIWQNTLESIMSPSSFYSIKATISACNNLYFTYSSEAIDFPGWKIVQKKYLNENKEYNYLLNSKQNQIVKYKKITATINLKNTVLHYTEARLIQILEEKGIGRPSTYSTIVDKIQEREYVKKQDIKGTEKLCCHYELENDEIFKIEKKREFGNEKGKLVIQQLGEMVVDFLEKHFNDLFDYNYTKQMEDDLDLISTGNKSKLEICDKYYKQIIYLLDKINEIKEVISKKEEIKIDDNHFYIIGKNGPVIKCVEIVNGKQKVSFKSIKKNIDFNKIKSGDYSLDEIVDVVKKEIDNKGSGRLLGTYENEELLLKKGKYGLYVTWGEKSKSMKCFGNRPIDNIRFEEVICHL
jgi:DNA topoisomerase-1